MNPNAAGTRLRRAVEELMDAFRVRKTLTTRTGKRETASLHSRILEFTKTHPAEGDVLLAVKWIGNEATHS